MTEPGQSDPCVRLASPGTATQFGCAPVNGDGMWLYDSGIWRYAKTPYPPDPRCAVDIQNCVIDGAPSAATPGARYYVYGYFAQPGDAHFSLQLSTTGPMFLNQAQSKYIYVKLGDISQRWLGIIEPDVAGVLWRAGNFGVYQDHIASYYQRQLLESQVVCYQGNNSPVWQVINTEQFISTLIWGDGADFQAALSGAVTGNVAGATVSIGVTRNFALPPIDSVPVHIPVAYKPVPFTVNISGGSVGIAVYRLDVAMKTSSGSGWIVGPDADGTRNGANLTMLYYH